MIYARGVKDLLRNPRYGSLYILASGNRGQPTRMAAGRYAGDGRLPPPMGLVWPKTTDTPAFSGSYTMNYNQQ